MPKPIKKWKFFFALICMAGLLVGAMVMQSRGGK